MLLFLLCIIIFPHSIHSQRIVGSNVNGHIYDAQTKQPITNVNVYIAYSQIGTTTNNEGYYRLLVIRPGTYKLIFSHVGYETIIKDLRIESPDEFKISIQLNPKLIKLPEVNVNAHAAEEWRKNLELFTRQLIGVTKNSKLTMIKNPNSLSFNRNNKNILYAESEVPLEIENNALGYNIKYFLEYFESDSRYVKYSGIPVFEEMQPSSTEQALEWKRERERAYKGSLRDFLNTLAGNYFITKGDTASPKFLAYPEDTTSMGTKVTYAQKNYLAVEGFNVIHTNLFKSKRNEIHYSSLVNTNLLLSEGSIHTEMKISYKDFLQVEYLNEKVEDEYLDEAYFNKPTKAQTSWIELKSDTVTFDIYGRYYDKFMIKTYGYMGFERLADTLPIDYFIEE